MQMTLSRIRYSFRAFQLCARRNLVGEATYEIVAAMTWRWSVGAGLCQKDNVTCGWLPRFFFLPPPFSQKDFSKKTFPPRVIPPDGKRPMICTRLPLLGAIALIVAMIFNCGVAVAGPTQTSADYLMPGCRDAASLITFSNAGESEEQASLMGFCAGIVVGLSVMGQPYGICVPAGTTFSKSPVSSFSTSTDSLRGFTRTSIVLPLRLCEQIGRVR